MFAFVSLSKLKCHRHMHTRIFNSQRRIYKYRSTRTERYICKCVGVVVVFGVETKVVVIGILTLWLGRKCWVVVARTRYKFCVFFILTLSSIWTVSLCVFMGIDVPVDTCTRCPVIIKSSWEKWTINSTIMMWVCLCMYVNRPYTKCGQSITFDFTNEGCDACLLFCLDLKRKSDFFLWAPNACSIWIHDYQFHSHLLE